MLNEIIHILIDVSRRREHRRGFQTEWTLNRGTVVVGLVKMIDGLFVIGTSVTAGTALIWKL